MNLTNPFTGTMDICGITVNVTVNREALLFGGLFEASAQLVETQNIALPEAVKVLQCHWHATSYTRLGVEVALYARVALDLLNEALATDPYFSTAIKQEDDGTLRILTLRNNLMVAQMMAHLTAFGGQNNVIRMVAYLECDGVHFDPAAHLPYDEKEAYAVAAAYIVHVMESARRVGMTAVMFQTR